MLDLLTQVIDNLPDMAVIVFDWDHRFHICRGPLHERLGYHKEHMEGKTVYEVLSPQSCDLLVPLYERTLHGDDFTVEFQGTELSDLTFWVNFVPIRKNSEVMLGMAIVKDVTEEKRLIEQRASEKSKQFSDCVLDRLGAAVMDHIGVISEDCEIADMLLSANKLLRIITDMHSEARNAVNAI